MSSHGCHVHGPHAAYGLAVTGFALGAFAWLGIDPAGAMLLKLGIGERHSRAGS